MLGIEPAPPPATMPQAPAPMNRIFHDVEKYGGPQLRALQAARQMWHQVGGYFGPNANMPAVLPSVQQLGFMSAVPRQYTPAIGASPEWEGAVVMSPLATSALQKPTSDIRNVGLAALVHEFAHMFQSPETYAQGRDTYEGGADAFNLAVSPNAIRRSGLGNKARVPLGAASYTPYVQKVLDTLGRDWILNGQFQNGSKQP